ncbi:MAG: hypothetical protein KDC00_07570 [Flavobacteriales bacterium]|nr:hypothetical protein [Flavobacteriales bacterium]
MREATNEKDAPFRMGPGSLMDRAEIMGMGVDKGVKHVFTVASVRSANNGWCNVPLEHPLIPETLIQLNDPTTWVALDRATFAVH